MNWNALWQRSKWFLASFVVGLIFWIDPKHIDDLVAQHPHWGGLILFLWGALLTWAKKNRPDDPASLWGYPKKPSDSPSKKVPIIIVLLLAAAAPAHAQFLGYVGLQTQYVRVLNNSQSSGRTRVQANIGASYHTFTYCLSGTVTAFSIFIEESPDGNDNTFTQISPVSGFPVQQENGNSCGLIRVGGYYSVLAVNITIAGQGGPVPSPGFVSVWYTSTAGVADLFPPAVNSFGATSPVQCDKAGTSGAVAIPPSTVEVIVNGLNAAHTYICGGTISFTGATTSGTIAFFEGQAGTADCGGYIPGLSPTLYLVAITPNSPQLFQINAAPNSVLLPVPIPVHPASASAKPPPAKQAQQKQIDVVPFALGNSTCIAIGAIGAGTVLTLSYAQF